MIDFFDRRSAEAAGPRPIARARRPIRVIFKLSIHRMLEPNPARIDVQKKSAAGRAITGDGFLRPPILSSAIKRTSPRNSQRANHISRQRSNPRASSGTE